MVVLILQHRFRHQPVQLGLTTEEPARQDALVSSAGLNLRERQVITRFDRDQCAVGALQIGRQQTIEVSDHNQRHVVGRVPILADFLQLLAGQLLDFCARGAFEAQLHGQLLTGGVTQVLTIQPALQMRVVTAVFALDYLFGGVDGVVVEPGLGQ
ncbi:hypothetical protein D3C86_1611400 [compost metagenome]